VGQVHLPILGEQAAYLGGQPPQVKVRMLPLEPLGPNGDGAGGKVNRLCQGLHFLYRTGSKVPAQPVCQSQPGGYAYEFVAFNSEDAVSRPERCSRETIAFCGAAAEGIRER